ncbi:MAG: asparagine synthase (glutamine-hydrolyzing) [Candidatus Electrothrix sp. AU1_5]|nr:asparagine synthase (glutamine-hydrolyzing) [Candidatus Electrothrix gigas]
MCGIAGFASSASDRTDLNHQTLLLMRDSLIHRGPDDAGIKLFNAVDGRQNIAVGLAHRRLSIIDLTQAGQQPISNEDGTVWITYNGECYNYQQLMQELVSKGHVFSSATDTEVLVHGYEQWGMDGLLKRLNGMFSFAIWDQRKQELLLARDRLGKKPLYYLQKGDLLVFASEIKAFEAGGFLDKQDIDPAALIQFWSYGYTTGTRTMYKGVRRVLPGHYLIWKDGNISIKEYWDVQFGHDVESERGVDDLADELEALLTDAVRIRLIADVPVGIFLSGGIDSSLIASLAAQVTGHSIRSFSIGFAERKFDETQYARAVADHLGIENTLLRVEDDLQPFFKPIARHFDELFGDSSAIPTWFVAKLAREHVTVALTGDAGDELFAGYDSYAKALSIWGNQEQRKLFKGRVSAFQQLVDFLQLRFVNKNQRISALDRIMPLFMLKKVLSTEVFAQVSIQNALHDREQWCERVANADLLSQLQYVYLKTYLPDDILVKVDRMTMAHALECRSPFLDYRVVEFAARLSFSHKISADGKGKYLLRHILKRYIPEHLIDRPKMGFSIPWSEWCKGPLGREIEQKWRAMNSPWFRKDAVNFLFPKNRLGWPARQWNAFCAVNLFNNND